MAAPAIRGAPLAVLLGGLGLLAGLAGAARVQDADIFRDVPGFRELAGSESRLKPARASHLETATNVSTAALAKLTMPEPGEKPWLLEKTGETDMAAAAARVAPIIWVPGITSSPLAARRRPGTTLGSPQCEAAIPKKGWYPLYVSAGWATQPDCLLWQLQLRPPRPVEGGQNGKHCVRDAEGIEIQEVGFGTTEGAESINPTDLVKFHLYEEMIKMFEGLGLKRGITIRYATYDWRKYGDPCWEEEWFPKLRELVENTVKISGRAVNIGCHSMGCPLVHNFFNTVDAEWKQKYISDFIAAGAPFAGAPQILQNFIQGPSYALLPMVVSMLGRATVLSMPGFFTLLPSRLANAWPEDLEFVSTPWKAYAIDSLYDGSFFSDVEAPEEEAGEAFEEEMAHFQDRADTLAAARTEGVKADPTTLITEQGCVCSSECQTTFLGVANPGHAGTSENEHDWLGLNKPWCLTYGSCGSRTLRLRLTLNPLGVLNIQRWDFCAGGSKPITAGPGFDFFPGVNTKPSFFLARWMDIGESYGRDTSLQIEEQKVRCLEQPECVGFDTDGYLKRGTDYKPDKSWRGITELKDGVQQGLYMKRAAVHDCQVHCELTHDAIDSGAVCGSDGKTYDSKCHLSNARCWKPDLRAAKEGPCEDAYRTPQGCECKSKCLLVNDKEKRCLVRGNCGDLNPAGYFEDTCIDSEGIDTGRGFEYFPRTAAPHAAKLGYVLQKKGWFETFHMDKLQEECGKDPLCGGFSTDGTLFTHLFRDRADSWDVAKEPTAGLYRKMASVASCQSDCGEKDGDKIPVCHKDRRLTFPSECDAKNFHCWQQAEGQAVNYATQPGPCQHYGNTGLHKFAQRFLTRAADLKPPGVPTVCMWITDVDTELSWRFQDFLIRGDTTKTSPGDGTVNSQSAEVPCRQWQQAQTRGRVKLMPLRLGGAIHVTMLWDRGFLDSLKRVLLDDDFSCQRVDGAIVHGSKDVPHCMCAVGHEKVFCDKEEVGGREFELGVVLAKCPSPVCK